MVGRDVLQDVADMWKVVILMLSVVMTKEQILAVLKACMCERELLEGGTITAGKVEDVDKEAARLRNLNGAIVELLVAIGKEIE